jgi:hypothetical protein
MAFEHLKSAGFDVSSHCYADVLFAGVFPEAIAEIEEVLLGLEIRVSELVSGGGGEGSMTQHMRRALTDLLWPKHNFSIAVTIDGAQPMPAQTHEIDHVRDHPNGKLALEIEWNNKDPFFDRDLENFNRLHANAAIAAAVIVTRGQTLQSNFVSLLSRYAERHTLTSIGRLEEHGIEFTRRKRSNLEQALARGPSSSFEEIWARQFVSDKYGAATTHWSKLSVRAERGVGNPCPWMAIGIPASIIIED